eukprot:5037576-Prymnesium_polylepis.1
MGWVCVEGCEKRQDKNPHFSALFRKKRLTVSAYLERKTWTSRSILNYSYEAPARGPTSGLCAGG